MKKPLATAALALVAAALIALPAKFAESAKSAKQKVQAPAQVVDAAKPAPSPGEIVAAALASDWVAIAASDLLVMDLAADAKGKARRVVIQLMPAPFSQGWVSNIRKLAAAKFWDGTSVNRVQDNYVTQWGDPNADEESTPKPFNSVEEIMAEVVKPPPPSKAKPLPAGLMKVLENEYTTTSVAVVRGLEQWFRTGKATGSGESLQGTIDSGGASLQNLRHNPAGNPDPYSVLTGVYKGWPVGSDINDNIWPVHCYGMVGVGRNLSPDTGTGAELYTVIGHAPRHLDRNIALVGRVIEGIEHLSSLPRGTEALGFYKTAEERVPILSVRIGAEVKDLPSFQYLSTESVTFAKYSDARANRRDPFFIKPAGGADICNIPVPVRRAP